MGGMCGMGGMAAQAPSGSGGGKGHIPGYIFKKTQLCRHWQTKGECSLGDRCNFAHGEEEIGTDQPSLGNPGNPVPNELPPWHAKAANPVPTAQQSNASGYIFKKTQLCRHWQTKGECSLGDRCNFAHGDEEIGTEQPTQGNPGKPAPTQLPPWLVKSTKPVPSIQQSNASSMQASMAKFYASQGGGGVVGCGGGVGTGGGGSTGFKKTQLCRHWTNKGHCDLGESCNFAHGEEQLGTAQPSEGNPGLAMGSGQRGGEGAGASQREMMNMQMQQMYKMENMMSKMNGMMNAKVSGPARNLSFF